MTQYRALLLVALVALGSTSAEAVKVKAHAKALGKQHAARAEKASRAGDVKDIGFDDDDADADMDMDMDAGAALDDGKPKKGGAKVSISQGSSKQIIAVINTLNDILASIKNEEKEETKNFGEFSRWCAAETKSFSEAFDNAKSVSEQSDVSEKEFTATIAHLSKEVEDIKALQDELKDTIDQAQAIRDDEKEKYTDEVQLNKQSVKQVQQAIGIVGKVHNKGGFLQNGVLQKLQLNEPGESNYVLGIMKGILEKLQKTRAELEAEEKKKVDMDTAFMTTKRAQVESAKSERAEKEVKLTETKIALVKAKAQLKRSAKQLEELTMMLGQTKRECDAKKMAWETRQEDRKREKAAIAQAIDFLGKSGRAKEASFLSMEDLAPSFVQMTALPEPELSLRQSIAESAGKATVESISVGPGDTKGALGVITNLIAILDKQQTDEDSKQKYCTKELDTKADEKVSAEDDIKQLKADAESKASTIATLVDEVKEMEAEVVKMRKSLDEAAAIRKQERASFQAGSRDRELAVKVLRQAMRVLENFYTTQDKTALAQGTPKALSKTPTRREQPKTWSSTKSTRKAMGSNIVIEMLDKVSSEILQEEKKARASEQEAKVSFETLQKETQGETDKLREEITERVKSKAKLVVQANSVKENQVQRQQNLKAIQAQIVILKEECTQLLQNYDKRKKARAFEMSQLKDVMDILHGSSSASRTGFIDNTPVMMDREAALLSDMRAPTKVMLEEPVVST
mmetsp:Transcript_77277/g.202764  ORF Transcript_77277/g.202764 Transcript_77277/m.202764 type:complete len:744 (+) Transcript_77277:162-2393(+)